MRRSILHALTMSTILVGALAVPATAAPVLGRGTDLAVLNAAQNSLSAKLGTSFGGSWLDSSTGTLTVGITNPSFAPAVRAAGAVPKLVAHSQAELDATMATLDARGSVPKSVTGWYVDVVRNIVVVDAYGSPSDVAALAGTSGLVTVERASAPVRPLWNLVGGKSLFFPPYVCSVGFNARGDGHRYVITAGHCTDLGGDVSGTGGDVGDVEDTSYPGNDYGIVRVRRDSADSTARISRYGQGDDVFVEGTDVVPVNGRVCRSGQTTGWHCGVVTATKQTVNYEGVGLVRGLTRTTACAAGGDSGGPFVSAPPVDRHVQAQGVLSGGSGDCDHGGVTFFQPVKEILNDYDLKLYTD